MPFFFRRLLQHWRAERLRGGEAVAGHALRTLFLYLVLIVLLHILAMMAFEGMSAGDAAWLTATTLTTVGYGDISAATPLGRIATVVLLYVGGIFALAKGAGDYFEYRAERRLRMLRGQWRWNLRDHVLVVNAPDRGAEHYFETFVTQLHATRWGADRPVLVLTDRWPDGLPDALHALAVVHVDGRGDEPEKLADAGVAEAAALVILAEDRGDPRADALTFDVLHRLKALAPEAPIFVEAVRDQNRDRLLAAGAHAVVRPSRSYPEMMVRALVAPGSEAIMENLFTQHSDDECIRYDVPVSGPAWADLVAELVRRGVGVPLAYAEAETGAIRCNPRPDEVVRADALYVVVKEGKETPEQGLRDIVRGLAA